MVEAGYAYGPAYAKPRLLRLDNHKFGWLEKHPRFHDVPGADITLTGENFTTEYPLTNDPADKTTTGAFAPFGTPTTAGQVIRGATKCSGAVLRVRPNGGAPELAAWRFRNPFGLAFAPGGGLYVTENGFDLQLRRCAEACRVCDEVCGGLAV